MEQRSNEITKFKFFFNVKYYISTRMLNKFKKLELFFNFNYYNIILSVFRIYSAIFILFYKIYDTILVILIEKQLTMSN